MKRVPTMLFISADDEAAGVVGGFTYVEGALSENTGPGTFIAKIDSGLMRKLEPLFTVRRMPTATEVK